MRKLTLLPLMLLTVVLTYGHAGEVVEETGDYLNLGEYLLIVALIGLIVAGFLFFLSRYSSNLPIKKFGVTAAVTLLINAILFGIFFVRL